MKRNLFLFFILLSCIGFSYAQNEILDVTKIQNQQKKRFSISLNFGREENIEKLSSSSVNIIDCASGEQETADLSDEEISSLNSSYKYKLYSNYINVAASYSIFNNFRVIAGVSVSKYSKKEINKETKATNYKLSSSSIVPSFKLGVNYHYDFNDLISIDATPSVRYGFYNGLKYDIITNSEVMIDEDKFNIDYTCLNWSVPVVASLKFKHITPFAGVMYNDFVNSDKISFYNDYLDTPTNTEIKSKYMSRNKIKGIAGVNVPISGNISIGALGLFSSTFTTQLSLNFSL